MSSIELQLSCDTTLSLPKDDFTEAVLGNDDALDALFKAIRDKDDLAGSATRCAVTFDVWEMVMPLISEAYREASGDNWDRNVGHAWADARLPTVTPLKEDATRRSRHKVFVLDYDGPPKVKLALELLWHWCDYVAGDESHALFGTLCELLHKRFKEHF